MDEARGVGGDEEHGGRDLLGISVPAGGGELGGRVYPVEGLDLFANYAINYAKQDRPAGCNVPEDGRTSRHKVNAGVQVRTKAGVELIPENPEFDTLLVTPESGEFELEGLAVGLIRNTMLM